MDDWNNELNKIIAASHICIKGMIIQVLLCMKVTDQNRNKDKWSSFLDILFLLLCSFIQSVDVPQIISSDEVE